MNASNVYANLDRFTKQFIETLLWSSTDDDGDPLDQNFSVSDIATEAMEKIIRDCDAFQAEHGAAIDAAEGEVRYGPDCGDTRERAGHDFALTRNGHGAGFWDGDWPEALGETLTDASKKFGEMNPYIGDDGMIYVYVSQPY